jgi:hypothetical protein
MRSFALHQAGVVVNVSHVAASLTMKLGLSRTVVRAGVRALGALL